MKYLNNTESIGDVDLVIDYRDGTRQKLTLANTVLRTGRAALAKGLTNDIGEGFQFYVSRMIFGNGGTNNGVPKYVSDGRNGLFGLSVVSKGVMAHRDPAVPTQAIFVSVIGFDEANNNTLNEMALQLANGDLYSMRTFPDLNKTQQMQLSFSWKIYFV